MRLNRGLIPVSALALALGAGQFSAEAAQRGDRGGRDQNQQGQTQERSGGANDNRRGLGQGLRERGGESRQNQAAPPPESRAVPQQDNRAAAPRDNRGGDGRDRRDNNRGFQDNNRGFQDNNRGSQRGWQDNRGGGYSYSAPRNYNAPRFELRGQVAPRRYGSGSNLSLYFQFGSGYRYGSPYSGRVYGYSDPSAVYGSRRYYGDVRLQIRPRNAAVFVDGYYAGVVDDFDGVFQRLTLEVGRHQIEVEAPGFEPQAFDVYVDPARTVDLHGDLFPDRRF